MKKRLGVFVEYFPPRLGGDRRIYEIMKNLSNDYDIHFFILPPSYTLFIREIESEQERKEEFIYDNMMDSSEDSDPTTALGGGNIIIHKS